MSEQPTWGKFTPDVNVVQRMQGRLEDFRLDEKFLISPEKRAAMIGMSIVAASSLIVGAEMLKIFIK